MSRSANHFFTGAGASVSANYIEDVFSTFLYTGTGSAQTITNGIDFSTNGGLLWLKARNDTRNNWLYDTTRSIANGLRSDSTAAATSTPDALTAFNSNGFSIGTSGNINTSSNKLVSWSFRKQKKFFDVVTYTGDGTNGRAISHNLGSTPGFIIVKSTSDAAQWVCWSRGFNSGNGYGYLNDTTAWFTSGEDVWGNGTSYIAPTSTTFTVKGGSLSNLSDRAYVAYLFAHDAGGFGLTGNDNVITCGSYTTGTQAVNLGWEPQWLLIKNVTKGDYGNPRFDNWNIVDNMRGGGNFDPITIAANTTGVEADIGGVASINNTGFTGTTSNNDTYVYIAIRRGLMKVPTDATTVFSRDVLNDPASTPLISSPFPVDLAMFFDQSGARDLQFVDRLRGKNASLKTGATDTEAGPLLDSSFDYSNGYGTGASNAPQYGSYLFRRARGFFDEVLYTGNGASKSVTHNLGVEPELIIFKSRSAAENWVVLNDFGPIYFRRAYLDLTNTGPQFGYGDAILNSKPSATTISLISGTGTNSVQSYVAWLFATAPGVSKVGKYTGTGTTLQVDCGFTAGARFVLVKRVDSTGDWYLWDTFRGIISGNDPYFTINAIATQVTNTDYIDPYSLGFELSSTAPAAINANGGTYIFLAIA